MIINLLFLIPLFIIGIISSYTDVKYGKIKNKVLLFGFFWVLILYLFLASYNYFFLHQEENIQYLFKLIINGLIALGVSYFLWNFRFLAAGDAKLFTIFALLLPLEFYSDFYFPYFPSLVLLINIFIPLLLFLGFRALIFFFKSLIEKIKENRGKFKITKKGIRQFSVSLLKTLRTYIIFILLFVVLQLLLFKLTSLSGSFFQKISPAYLFLFIFFIYRFLFKFISKKKLIGFGIAIVGFVSLVYLLISGQTIFLFNIIKIALVFMILIGVFHRLLNFYIERQEVKEIMISDLEEGMLLFVQEIDQELKKKIGSIGQFGINQGQIGVIRNFFQDKPQKRVKIYKTFALAPFMLLGVVISILTKSSFISWLLSIFNS